MKQGYCWLCGEQKKVMQTTVDGHHRWLCKKCEIINRELGRKEEAK